MSDEIKKNVFAGIAFLVLGLLIFVPSGICTGIFGGGALLDAVTHPDNWSDSSSMLFAAILFGGPFVVAGILLIRVGIKRLRGK